MKKEGNFVIYKYRIQFSRNEQSNVM